MYAVHTGTSSEKVAIMSQLGERLRAAREAQGIAVSQASADTRILPRYIVALEDGDYQHLPGDVYARGFIRNYANYLGMPPDELIELYRLERGTTDAIKVVATTSTPRIRGLFVPSFFGVFFVVLALVGISYLLLSLTNNLGDQSVAQAPITTAVPTPEPLPTWGTQPTIAPVIASEPTAAPAAPEAPTAPVAGGTLPTPEPTATSTAQNAPIVASVRVAEGNHNGSWLKITADRKVIYEAILKPGMVFPFTAQSNVAIRAGNAGVVFVTVNGVEQGPLGAEGKVFDFAWPPQ